MLMRKILKGKNGDGGMVPVYILIGVIVFISVGFIVLNQFVLVQEDYPQDNGIFLDQEDVEYGEPYAVLEIERFGAIKIRLEEQIAPIAVANFVKLCNQGFYNGLTFHRVIPDFMIQGGDPTGDGTGGPGYTIEGEANNGLVHDKGALAMAKRSGETRMSGSQFYIVQGEEGTHHLDGEHTVFGFVVQGLDIVDNIAYTQTDANDKPLSSVIIESAYIVYE